MSNTRQNVPPRITVLLTKPNLKWLRGECAKRRSVEGVYVPPARLINELIAAKRDQEQEPKPVKRKAEKAQTVPMPVSA
jgi:hypothetical protein